MNWVFLDDTNLDYDISTPLARPLGGSQSALCYLAAALAVRGHRVTTITGNASPRVINGVRCLSNHTFPLEIFSPEETFLVALNGPADLSARLRRVLPPHVVLVLWTQHAHDQIAMRGLLDPACAALWDRIVCVSDWQRTIYHGRFRIPFDWL